MGVIHLLHSEVQLWAQDGSGGSLLGGGQDLFCLRWHLVKVLLETFKLHLDFLLDRRRQQHAVDLKLDWGSTWKKKQKHYMTLNHCFLFARIGQRNSTHSEVTRDPSSCRGKVNSRPEKPWNSLRTAYKLAILGCIFTLESNTDCKTAWISWGFAPRSCWLLKKHVTDVLPSKEVASGVSENKARSRYLQNGIKVIKCKCSRNIDEEYVMAISLYVMSN